MPSVRRHDDAAPARTGERRTLRRSAHQRPSQLPVRELAKFGIVSAFTVVAAGGGSALLYVRAGTGPLTSAVIATVVVGAVSYAGNRCWTFRHRQRIGIRRESVRYAALYAAGLVVQLTFIALTTFVLGRHQAFRRG